jgi:hypothetical protein
MVIIARDTGLSRHILILQLPPLSEDYNIRKAKAFRFTVFSGSSRRSQRAPHMIVTTLVGLYTYHGCRVLFAESRLDEPAHREETSRYITRSNPTSRVRPPSRFCSKVLHAIPSQQPTTECGLYKQNYPALCSETNPRHCSVSLISTLLKLHNLTATIIYTT